MRSVLLLALLVTPATAADCPLKHATYAEKDAGYVLQFKPRPADAYAVTTNYFSVIPPDGGRPLEGMVMWGNGTARPDASLGRDCPADVFSPEEADVVQREECTLWGGVIYALGNQSAALLPDSEEEPAPDALLLPDLGRTIRYSDPDFGKGQDTAPWDVFTLTGCVQ